MVDGVRTCDNCGTKMAPYTPRKRVGDQYLCSACVRDPANGGKVTVTAAEDYHGGHRPAASDYGPGSSFDDPSGLMPDVHEHPEWYDQGTYGRETIQQLRAARGNPEHPVTVYRALPHPHRAINTGDWVTPSSRYADQHATNGDPYGDGSGDWPVIKATVPAKYLNGHGDMHEWGYNGPPIENATLHHPGGKRASRKTAAITCAVPGCTNAPKKVISYYWRGNHKTEAVNACAQHGPDILRAAHQHPEFRNPAMADLPAAHQQHMQGSVVATNQPNMRAPLPVDQPGTYYRLHYAPRPWGAEQASSAPWYPTGTHDDMRMGFEEDQRQHGYSAMSNPHHLMNYLHNSRWLDHAKRIGDHHIVQFTGTPTGEEGVDGEPLVTPTNRRDRVVHTIDQFEQRLGNTPDPQRDGHTPNQRASYNHVMDLARTAPRSQIHKAIEDHYAKHPGEQWPVHADAKDAYEFEHGEGSWDTPLGPHDASRRTAATFGSYGDAIRSLRDKAVAHGHRPRTVNRLRSLVESDEAYHVRCKDCGQQEMIRHRHPSEGGGWDVSSGGMVTGPCSGTTRPGGAPFASGHDSSTCPVCSMDADGSGGAAGTGGTTAARPAPPLPNPLGGDKWYHGTSFDSADDPEEDPTHGGELETPDRTEYEYGQHADKHWNTDLGVHFTSHELTAKRFAANGGSGYSETPEMYSRIAHAHLHMANPRVYKNETEMANHVISIAHQHGLHYLPEDDEAHHRFVHEAEVDSDEDEGRLNHTLSFDRSDRQVMSDLDRGAQQHSLPHLDMYLSNHPERPEVMAAYRKHLAEHGHDGVVYGNEYEGPHEHQCAIATEPESQVHVHHWDWMHPAMQHLNEPEHAMTATGAKDWEPPTVSGVALRAADTGRLLMIQRSNKDEKDPAKGTWEFPGGHHEDGDRSSLDAGVREWEEEVGQKFPEGGAVTHTWRTGPYQGHVVTVPDESCVDFSEGRATTNPDDPDGDDHEQSAWWEPEHARKNPALRQEIKDNWKAIAPGIKAEARREVKDPDMNTRLALRAVRTGMRLIVVAHDSGDGETIYHCPFCGSGQVIARSDKTVECEFCHTAFTVQVQPELPNFPQTINGMPVQVPGMPGEVGQDASDPVDPTEIGDDGQSDDQAVADPMDPSDAPDPDSDPTDQSADDDSDDSAGASGGGFSGMPSAANQPPWLRSSSYRTNRGRSLGARDYVAHVALATAADRNKVLDALRTGR